MIHTKLFTIEDFRAGKKPDCIRCGKKLDFIKEYNGFFKGFDSNGNPISWFGNGRCTMSMESDLDLIITEEMPDNINEFWINNYPTSHSLYIYRTKEDAERNKNHCRIGIYHITHNLSDGSEPKIEYITCR